MEFAAGLVITAKPRPFPSVHSDAARKGRWALLAPAIAWVVVACAPAPRHGPPPTETTPSVGYIVLKPTEDEALLVPQQAVTRDADGQPVAYIVGHQDKLERRVLSLGRAIGDQWVVKRGLAPGERLVVDGAQKATPGTLVAAAPGLAKAAE